MLHTFLIPAMQKKYTHKWENRRQCN